MDEMPWWGWMIVAYVAIVFITYGYVKGLEEDVKARFIEAFLGPIILLFLIFVFFDNRRLRKITQKRAE